ncbi:iron chelate uptake ABC transporter family permease subunit, partial [Achromobacter xylosoxidans]|uniref:iron chelate uptake ABC transporter family permease subunit n=1 Tax=Alcaligenes xylosoxydans xylosoxydans TaxID=85698 RepID=UPI000A624FC6
MKHRAHSVISSARVLRAGTWLAWPVAPRALAWAALLLVLACALLVTALLTGEPALSWQALGQTLLGAGGAVDRWLVHTVRLPRVLTALGAGAALGLAFSLLFAAQGFLIGAAPDFITNVLG